MEPRQAATAQVDRDGPGSGRSRFGLREYLTGSWILAVIAFTIARVVVAKSTLEQYGLNIWVFGFIDLITAVPYAVGIAKVVTSLIDRRPGSAGKWGIVAALSFIAPYLVVAWAGRTASFPPAVWIALVLLIAGFGANALWNIYRKVRDARRSSVGGPSLMD